MAALLTDLGEEWTLETALEGASISVGLYNDSTDAISDANDLADITTEPSGAAYSRQSTTLTMTDGGDWQVETSAQVSFDTSDSSQNVDSYFLVANFQADDTGDGSATDHLIATGALSQSRDLSQIDTLNIAAGSAGFSLS
jgi:hypothetical protein